MFQAEVTCVHRTATIRTLNDQLRMSGVGGKVMLTRAVAAMPPPALSALLAAVRKFDDFTSRNHPYREHDFGSVSLDGETYFFKIEAYDINLEWGSPDPADETVTRRVMTIMHAADY